MSTPRWPPRPPVPHWSSRNLGGYAHGTSNCLNALGSRTTLKALVSPPYYTPLHTPGRVIVPDPDHAINPATAPPPDRSPYPRDALTKHDRGCPDPSTSVGDNRLRRQPVGRRSHGWGPQRHGSVRTNHNTLPTTDGLGIAPGRLSARTQHAHKSHAVVRPMLAFPGGPPPRY